MEKSIDFLNQNLKLKKENQLRMIMFGSEEIIETIDNFYIKNSCNYPNEIVDFYKIIIDACRNGEELTPNTTQKALCGWYNSVEVRAKTLNFAIHKLINEIVIAFKRTIPKYNKKRG